MTESESATDRLLKLEQKRIEVTQRLGMLSEDYNFKKDALELSKRLLVNLIREAAELDIPINVIARATKQTRYFVRNIVG